jgi:hypothetical protein
MKILFLICFVFICYNHATFAANFTYKNIRTEMNSSVKHFSYGMEEQTLEAKSPVNSPRLREGKIAPVKFADLENRYFDSVSTKASALKNSKSTAKPRKRSR